jgi:hypothetical protein
MLSIFYAHHSPKGEGAWQDSPLERRTGRYQGTADPRARPKRSGGVSCPWLERDNGLQIFFIFLPVDCVLFFKDIQHGICCYKVNPK